jgi:hypothetical protein
LKIVSTMLATAAFFALATTAFAQVTPGGPGERKNAESPPVTASQSPAGVQPRTQTDYSRKGMSHRRHASRHHHRHRMMKPGDAGSGQMGARKAGEAPAMKQ